MGNLIFSFKNLKSNHKIKNFKSMEIEQCIKFFQGIIRAKLDGASKDTIDLMLEIYTKYFAQKYVEEYGVIFGNVILDTVPLEAAARNIREDIISEFSRF